MPSSSRKGSFLGSKSGQGLIAFLAFSLVVSVAVAWGFYSASVAGFEAHKSEEKQTALRLVDAFVQTYTEISTKIGPGAPVPATFRAHSIDLFGKADPSSADEFRLRWVGRTDRSIATPPSDAAMAATIESFANRRDPKPQSKLLDVGATRILRTVYPSYAQQQGCVDCHNAVQPSQHWALGDLMGAFVIDVPAGPAMRQSLMQAVALGAALFLVLAGAGFTAALIHDRQAREREAAQESLRESEARLGDFAATASDWFWEQDEALRFVFSSSGAPDMAERIVGKTRRELFEGGENFGLNEAQLAAHEADLAARRPFQNMRFQRNDAGGEIRYVSVSGRPVFDSEGRFKGYRGTGRDITAEVSAEIELGHRVEERTAELRKAQIELVRREKLSTLGQLTATVAHELRNPLSAIRNTVFAVKETLTGSGLNLDRPLSRVERNITRCDRIIADLLDFTRMPELNCAPLDVDTWLEEVLNDQRLPDGVILRREFGAGGPLVSFDPERMRRVIVNLVENAAQAMVDQDGRERAITVRTRVNADMLEVAVEDTGPGIARDILGKVFEPLFSTKSFGTGLGLPTVRQIVEQHGGTVTIASEVGHGTKVAIRLPMFIDKEMAA